MRKRNIARQNNRKIQIETDMWNVYLSAKEIIDLHKRLEFLQKLLLKTVPCIKKWMRYSGHECRASRVTLLEEKSLELIWMEFVYFSDRIMAPHRLHFIIEFCQLDLTKETMCA